MFTASMSFHRNFIFPGGSRDYECLLACTIGQPDQIFTSSRHKVLYVMGDGF